MGGGLISTTKEIIKKLQRNMFILLYHSQLMFKFITHTTFQKIKKGILDKISKLTLIKT